VRATGRASRRAFENSLGGLGEGGDAVGAACSDRGVSAEAGQRAGWRESQLRTSASGTSAGASVVVAASVDVAAGRVLCVGGA